MVLEYIIPNSVKQYRLFFSGLAYSIIAFILTSWLFNGDSMVLVGLTVIAALPFMRSLIEEEEKQDHNRETEHNLLRHHAHAIGAFIVLFLGITAGFASMHMIMPVEQTQDVFSMQYATLQRDIGVTGNFIGADHLGMILGNNLRVLMLCVLFSFMYGAGAIFILTWNASVLGTVIGLFIRDNLLAASVGGYAHVTFLVYLDT